MKGKKQSLKRFLALLLSAAMIITYMPSGFITYAEDVDSSVVAEEQAEKAEAPKEEAPKVETQEETKSEPEVKEEPAEDVKEDTQTPDAEETIDSQTPEQTDDSAEAGDSGDTGETVQPEEGQTVTPDQDDGEPKEDEEEVKYPAQDFEESTSDTLVTVHAPEGELPEGTKMHVKNVSINSVTGAVQDKLGEDVKVIKAIDITFTYEGKEIEPKGVKPLSVSFNSAKFAKNDDLSVVHIDDDKNVEKVSDKVVENNGSEVAFQADSFSIYVVVEGIDPDARLNVNFYDADGETLIATMSLTKTQLDAGQMNTNIYDPGVGTMETGEVFKGWTEKKNYDVEDSENGLDIAGVRDKVTALLNAGTVTDGQTINLYAMMFQSYHISYRDELGVTIFTDEVLYKEGSTDIPYTVQFTYTPYYVTGSGDPDDPDYDPDKAANFAGWAEVNTNTDPETLGEVHQNGDSINLADSTLLIKDSTLTLLAQTEYGHWLVFNENAPEGGASYTAPLFVNTESTPATAGFSVYDIDGEKAPTRKGYIFGGWYTDAACTTQFNPNQVMVGTTTIYAKWTEESEASFNVLIWRESLSGGYDFVRSIPVNATTGDNMSQYLNATVDASTITVDGQSVFIPLTSNENNANAGFMYKRAEYNNEGKVASNGTSVANVYFDRREYTLKFYYARSNSNGRYQVSQNYDAPTAHGNNGTSTAGTWAPSSSQSATAPASAFGELRTETRGRYTYYYRTLTAKYGEDISNKWPTYNGTDFATWTANGSTYRLGSWAIMHTSQSYINDGQGTVKGKITVMDEGILGDLSSSDGNYVYANYDTTNRQYEWWYHIYFKNASGNYVLYEDVFALSHDSGSNWQTQQHPPMYPGMVEVDRQRVGNDREINYYYDPLSYPILFKDGVYEDGNHTQIANKSSNTLRSLQDDNAIPYMSSISEYNSYDPTSVIPDGEKYVFLGWYSDDTCTQPYNFTTMPAQGITVYAKWMLKEYKVTLHSNADGDDTFTYTDSDQPEKFYADNGEKIGNVGGTRDLYDLLGWFANESLTKVWDFDAFELNDTIVSKYGELYALDGTDSRYDPEYPGTVGEINLYASWRRILDGADGINVFYTAVGKDGDGNTVTGTNAPTDPNQYSDQAKAIARPAAKAPTAGEGETQLAFQYWVVQKWNGNEYVDTEQKVFPGDRFIVNYEDAKSEAAPTTDNPNAMKYTVQLRAQYGSAEDATPTHIYWYNNYTDSEEGIIRKDDDLAINETVTIPAAPTRAGYKFLGWARSPETNNDKTEWYYTKDVGEEDLFLTYDSETNKYSYTATGGTTKTATGVFADENTPYDGMYAVWEAQEVSYTVEYYYMNDNGTYPTTATSSDATRKAETDTTVEVTPEDKTPSDADKYALDGENTSNVWTATVEGDGSTVLKVYFKLNKATVTIHHYLKGTTTKVADDVTSSQTIGTEYTATPVTTYQEKDLTVDSVNPTQPVTVVAGGVEITYYYTLPLTVTVADKTTPYNGQKQYGYGDGPTDTNVTITGLLGGDNVSELNYTKAEGTLVGEYTGSFSADPTVTNGTDTVSYYTVDKTAGKLTITDENVNPSLVVTKDDGKDADYKYKEGDTVTFTITVKNIYAEAKSITLSEIDDVTLAESTFNDVAAGATVTTTATYTIKPADMAAGSFTNTVTATLNGKTYEASDTVNTETAAAELTVTKSASKTEGAAVNDVITYTVTVKNTGNVTVTNIDLADAKMAAADKPAPFTLAPNQSSVFRYNYTVTQADVDAGKIDNTATATGKDPVGEDVTDSDDATVTTVASEPALTVTKEASKTTDAAVNDVITYTVTVENTGNVTVKDIALSDTLVTLTEEAFTLAPGEKKDGITYTYTVKQSDVDAGIINNTVTATGKDPKNADVTKSASATVTTVTAAPELTVTKTASKTSNAAAGDEITYTVTVENTGNVTVKDIALSDTLVTLSEEPFTLAPGAKKEGITYTYTVTQADVDAGKIDNTVTATGKDPKDADVTDDASVTVTAVEKNAAIEVTKTSDKTNAKPGVDETVTYSVTVKNTGNVTVEGITLSDTLVTLTDAQKAIGDLAPAGEKTISYTYKVTQDDVDTGKIDNKVTAEGTDPQGETVSDYDELTVTAKDAAASLTVEKTADPTSGVKVGDTVKYTVVVTNNGNVTVRNIGLVDPLMAEADAPEAFTLAPKGTKTVTYEYTVTQADVDAGVINNTATATGKDPKDNNVTASDSAEVTTVEAEAALTVEKTADPTEGVKVGDTVTYTVVVTNSGNVTVTGIGLTDTLVAQGAETFDLAPAGTKTITYTYTVQQKDVDAGKIDNTVTAAGKDPKGTDVSGTDSATVTTIAAEAALTVEKTAAPASNVKVGDKVTYTVVVTNSGNVTVSDIAMEDTLVTLEEEEFDLAPAGTKTITYEYTVTQADVNKGSFDNTATATGKNPKGTEVTASDDATVTTIEPNAELTVEKTANPTSGVKKGDKVTYTVVVTNSGNVTVRNIQLSDTKVDLEAIASEPAEGEGSETGDGTGEGEGADADEPPSDGFTLDPSGTKTITYEYTVTQSDIDAGKIDNTATATGKDPVGEDVTDSDDATVTTVASEPALTVTKEASKTTDAAVNDVITYTVTVENTGNVTVKDIALSDTLVTLTEEAFTLAPGEKKDGITYTYTVKQSDVDAGIINNTVTATGKDPKNADVTKSASATVTTVTAAPELTVTKTASKTSNAAAGDEITYTVTVENTGNVTVKDIALSDTLVTLSEEPFTLAPGAKKEGITYTYTVTQADVDAGKIDNTVTATGKDPKDADVTDDASVTVTAVEKNAAIEVTKTSDKTNAKPGVDETVTYSVTVKNTGNVTVEGITLSDTLVTLTDAQKAIGDLAPAGEKTISYTYKVTQDDVDTGKIDNKVTAEGTDPQGETVSDYDELTVTAKDAAASLTVEKTADPTSGVKVGDTVKYTVVVTNNGNVTVRNIGLVDPLMAEADAPEAFTLAPKGTKTVTYEYTVTQADVDAGVINNTATATGKDPKDNNVTASDSAEVTTVEAEAALTVEKTADPTEGVKVGDTVTYTVVVTNSGNVTVTGIGLTDTLVAQGAETFDLAPAGTKTITYTYTVQQKDVDAGKIDNTVTAAGKDPKGTDVSGTDSATVTTIAAEAALTVEKTAAPASNVKVGDKVTYTVVVTNSGNVTVSDIAMEDTLVTLEEEEFDLAPAGTKTITYEYTVTQADVNKGSFDNTATATGKDPKGTEVTASDDATVTTVAAAPAISVEKSADKTSNLVVGDVVTYTVTVENTGNVALANVKVSDSLVTDVQKTYLVMAPEASESFTYTYTVTQADVDAGKIDNTATAAGYSVRDSKAVTDDASVTVNTVAAEAALTVEKTSDPTANVKAGDKVTYTVVVTNSGNVTVSGIKLADTLVPPAGTNAEEFTLAPSENKEFTYEYVATQADIDAGKIDNTATATGKDPKGAEVTASDNATVTAVAAAPALTVEKTAEPTSGVKVGDKVKYTVVVTNSGNVTVSGIAMSDTLVTLSEEAFALAPAATKTITYEYTVTQADVDAGKIDNIATAAGKDPKGTAVTASDNATVTTVEAAGAIEVTKTASKNSGAAAKDVLNYTVTVENTGNVTIKGITLEDTLVDLDVEAFDLAPGAKKEGITYTYTVTQADVDKGQIDNTVTATGKDPKNADVTDNASVTVTANPADAQLEVTKSANPASGVEVGNKVTYTVVVSNPGNVTVSGIKLSDTLVPPTGANAEEFTLAPEGSKTFTYEYTVTQGDVDAGEINNTASAVGKDPKGNDVTASDNAKVTTVEAEAALTVEKTAEPTEGVKAGDSVTYTVVVTNSGNVTVSGIAVSDSLVTLGADAQAFDLAPNAAKTITYTYTVKQADVDAGKIGNTATATGEDPDGNEVTATGSETVTAEEATAELTVEKTADPTSGVKVGDTVEYTVVVTNSGNVTLSDVALEDTLVTLTDTQKAIGELAPEGSKTITYEYTVTQADVDAGKIDNTATATGTSTRPGTDEETGEATYETVTAEDDATVTTVAAAGALTVEKTAAPASNVKVGDKVAYTVVVTNSGNVTLSNVTLADTLVTLTDAQKAIGTLAPAGSKTINYEYTVTQKDVDAGKIDNTATATGTDPKDTEVTGTDDATVTTVAAAPALTVEKTADPTSNVKVGDKVTYTVVVTNSGNVTVSGIAMSDTLVTLSEAAFELAPAGTKTITYEYTVTQADVDAGKIDNTATAAGKDPKGTAVTASDDATVTTVASDAKLTVEKTAAPTANLKVGDKVTYTVVVTNSGNVTVSGIAMSDTLVTLSGSAFDLAPAGTKTITYEYTVTQADVDAGKIDNTATATGKDPKNNEVTASDNATVTTVAAAGALTVEKTADTSAAPKVGEEVTYTVVVTNSGNVTITGIKLADTLVPPTGDNAEAFDLAPAGTKTFTYKYKVTQDDVDNGSFTNTASAAGKDPSGKTVSGEDSVTVSTDPAAAKLTVTKTADPKSGVAVDDEITYTVVVKNDGNVTVKDIALSDSLVTVSEAAFTLAPGAEKSFTYKYTATQADVDAGQIDNTATATGKDPKNAAVTATGTATVTTEAAEAEISVTKTAEPTSGVVVGDEISYTAVVTNTGNVTVKEGTLEDDHADLSAETFELAPGVSKTVTYKYIVTQDDVDAGSIVNVVKANAKAVRGDAPKEATATATVTTEAAEAELAITKTATPTSGVTVGDEIDYTVTVTNSGNVTVNTITLADDHGTPELNKTTLAPGETVTANYTYTVTQADVDAGSIVNTAKANGKAVRGDDPAEVSAQATVTTVAAASSLGITKTASPTSGVKAGDTVTYTVVVTNTGNVSVKDGTLSDDHADLSKETFALAPEASKTFTYTYKVTQADIDAGTFTNTVKANATAERGENPAEVQAQATVTAEAASAKLGITKEASTGIIDSLVGVAVGDVITYTVEVTNEGNVSVKNGTLSDDHADLAGKTFALAPGEKTSFEYTYTVTQADVDAGSIVNVVKANAKAERGQDPTEVSDTATVKTVAHDPELTVEKSADPTEDVAVDDEITYTVVVSNTGNVTITGIEVTDELMAEADKPAAFDLAPGESKTITYTYIVTQADVDAGVVTNAATATGTDPDDEPTEDEDSIDVPTEDAAAELSITKSANKVSGVKAGDKIQYTVVVTNEGNVTVKDGELADDHADLSEETFTLAPGASATFNYEYTVLQSDIDTGSFTNTVKANATAVRGDDPAEVTAQVTVTAEDAAASLSITKTADPTSGVEVGDTITYTVVVRNEGNVGVKAGTLADDHADLSEETFALAPGEEAEFEYTYEVTQADVDTGRIENVVKANATAVRGDNPAEVTASAVVETVEKDASLNVVKTTTSEPANGKAYALGETITYKITVTNNGNVTISDVQVTDALTGDVWNVEGSLAPGASEEFTTSYTVTEADILAGEVLNVATATGKDPDGEDPEVTPGEDPEPTDEPDGHLTVTKVTTSETPEGGYPLGSTISYKITVKNDGNLTITDIEVTDELTGDKWPVKSLAPGASEEFTTSYTVTEADVLAGEVLNVATATGTSPDPDEPDVPVTPGEDPEPTEEPDGHLTVSKETTSTPKDGKAYALGEEISYKITVLNDGNLTITDIEVTDDLTGDKWPVANLAPGASEEFTTKYTVTEADVLAGEVLNVATATGTSPDPDDPDVPVTPGEDPEPTEDPDGHLTVTKETTSEPKDGKAYVLGETVSYKITVTNDGNLTITDIEVTDELTGDKWTVESLAPGASEEFTASHDVTEADILAGKVHNEATATGTSPDPDEPEVPVEPGTKDDPTEDPNGHLTVNKTTTSTPANGKTYALDETVSYKITVTNDGNLTITDIEVKDDKTGDTWPVASLAPGASEEFEATYKVTEADILAGKVLNVATAEGTSPDPDKPDVPVKPGEKEDPTDDPAPSIDVEKSSNKVDGVDVPAGSDLTYTVKVTNTGNVTLNNITLTDDHGTPEGYETTLAPGASMTVDYNYTITDADDEAGKVTNTVTGEGVGTNGETVNDTDSITTIVGTNDINPTPDPKDEDEEMSADGKSVTVMYDGHEHTVSAEATKPGSTILYSTDGGETWSEDAPVRTVVGETDFDIKATNPDYEDVVKTGYKLVVTKRPITLVSASDEKVYDGTPLVRNEQSDVTIGGEGLADTDKLTFNITGSQTYVGSSDNEFTYTFSKETNPAKRLLNRAKSYFTAYADDADEPKIEDNYDITVSYGTLTVTDKGVDPDKVVTKTHEGKKYKVGEEIEFTVKATNIYDEAKTITLIELKGVELEQSVFEDVQPGETVETTAYYTVTKEDAKKGKFTNVIKVKYSGENNEFTNEDTVDKIEGADGHPKTGDNGYGFDLTMLFGSAAALIAMLAGRRRREQE